MLKLGEEQTVTTPDGRTWTLSRLELRHVRAFREYVVKAEGDPFEVVERFLGKLADSELMPLLKEAEKVRDQLRAFSMGCPLAQRHLGTEEGLSMLVGALLKKRHPDATEEDAFGVAVEVNRRLDEVLKAAQGELPPNGDGRVSQEASPAASTGGKSTAD